MAVACLLGALESLVAEGKAYCSAYEAAQLTLRLLLAVRLMVPKGALRM